MKKTLLLTAFALLFTAAAAELKIDFNAEKPWKEMRNHSKRVKFETKEFQGKKATVVTFAAIDKATDTAFSLETPSCAVKDKKEVTVKFDFAGAKGMQDFKGGGTWCMAVRFYNSAKKEITPVNYIKLPAANGSWQSVTQKIAVPAGAVTALAHFGFDHPNITAQNFFAITNVSIVY